MGLRQRVGGKWQVVLAVPPASAQLVVPGPPSVAVATTAKGRVGSWRQDQCRGPEWMWMSQGGSIADLL